MPIPLGTCWRRAQQIVRVQRKAVLSSKLDDGTPGGRGDRVASIPGLDGGEGLAETLANAPVAAEAKDDRAVLVLHTQSLRKLRGGCQRITRRDAHTQPAYHQRQNAGVSAVPDRPVSKVARTLKRLREKAGISIPQMAAELGMKRHSSYQHYEDRYKKDELPIDLAVRIAAILRKAGISDDELMELGTAAVAHDSKLDAILAEMQEMRRQLDALLAERDAN